MILEEKKAELLAMNEVTTYFLIDECGAFIWSMNHEMSHKRIPESEFSKISEDIVKVREIQQFVVDNLGRFGIDPESAKDRGNGDYWKWFRFYDNWKKSLSNDDWNLVSGLLELNQSVEEYLPKGSWKD